jgi:RNA polymerase sigma-70 factor, ECF subfamily
VRSHDPLANPGPLIKRTYAYVAYRIGVGPDAEDVTSAAVERALRYRSSYDSRKGDPASWLIGIARACVYDHLRLRKAHQADSSDHASSADVETSVIRSLSVREAVATLDERDRELIALRYGADLSTREIGRLLEMKPNAVDVALSRARDRLRGELERLGYGEQRLAKPTVSSPAPEASG